MAKLRVLSNGEYMDLVKDIQKNYRLPYPAPDALEKRSPRPDNNQGQKN